MAHVNEDYSWPHVFLIQSPFPDKIGYNLVLGYANKGGTMVLTLQEQVPGMPQSNQLFRVYEKNGLIQNLELSNDGFLTRATDGTNEVHLGSSNPGDKDQDWFYAAGPIPDPTPGPDQLPIVPGGGPHGSDKYTITATTLGPKDKFLMGALVLTVPVDDKGKGIVGATLQVATPIQPTSDPRRLANQQLWFFYWIPKAI